jgi:Holliday junction DNA helicase RuvB
MSERMLAAVKRDEDQPEVSLRPQTLSEFIGQPKVCSNLKVFIEAARARREALDHVLFAGPPGLGKTTLAQIVARELGVNFRATSGPVIARAGDLAALLTNLEDRDVLFIDEIHRLNPAVEEILYPAMEDFQLDLIIGEGPAARSVRIDLSRFTLIGATTRTGLLTTPLRERFGIPIRLEFYGVEELEEIVRRGARLLGLPLTGEGAHEIARRARGTPRVAGRLLRRVRDFASVAGASSVDARIADGALSQLEVDGRGLDALDHRYLRLIATNYGGGPVGIETIAAGLSEPRDAIEEIIEPYLLQQGFIARPRADGPGLRASRSRPAGAVCHPVSPVQRQRRMTKRRNWPDLAGRIQDDRHVLPIRVYFEDTDCGGVVYHANFLKFCERGRSDFIRLLGIDAQGLANPEAGEPAIFVVRHVEIDYLKPGRMDDVLEIVTTCAEIGSASLKLRQDVMRDGTLIVCAVVTVVLVGRSGKPQRLGALVRNALQRFVNQARET